MDIKKTKTGKKSGKNYTRRNFLGSITAATIASIGAGLLPATAFAESNQSRNIIDLPKGATVLFQGDSITDAGRNRNESEPNTGLGTGYTFLAAADLRHSFAREDLQCYNRGISGNKVFQLAERWQEDCLDLKPDVLSILIGVNDFWHTLGNNYEGTPEIYENDFAGLLERTRKALPDVKLIIGEPFVVKEGSAVTDEWFPEFSEYREAARRIASDFDAAFVPYQSVFDEAGQKVSPVYWAADGVHPTLAGAQLMARAWLETFKRM